MPSSNPYHDVTNVHGYVLDQFGTDNWALPAVIRHDYHGRAVINIFAYALGYVPPAFLVFSVIRRPEFLKKYAVTVMFAGGMQTLLNVPAMIWDVYIGIVAYADFPTTVGSCSWFRGIGAMGLIVSFATIPIVAISRYLVIVRQKRSSLPGMFWALGALAVPCAIYLVYYMFWGLVVPNDVCSQIMAPRNPAIALIYTVYIVAIIVSGIVFNARTLIFVLVHSRKKGMSSSSGLYMRNEISITVGLLLQSFVPLITQASVIVIYWIVNADIQLDVPDVVLAFLDTLNTLMVGLNIIASCIFVRAFRGLFVEMLFCGRRMNIASSHRIARVTP